MFEIIVKDEMSVTVVNTIKGRGHPHNGGNGQIFIYGARGTIRIITGEIVVLGESTL